MKEKKPFRERNICIPVAETAGEDMETLTGPFSESIYKENPTWQAADNLNKFICDSNAYILALPVSEANVPFVPDEFRDSMDQPVNSEGHFADPDLTLKRILSSVFRFKKDNPTSPKIEGIAILLTKADKILHFIKGHGMNLNTPDGQQKFLTTYFRQTSSVLKFFGLQKVRFFPVFVEVEKVRTPEGKVTIHKDHQGKPRIALDREHNLPLFSKTTYTELIHWILDTLG